MIDCIPFTLALLGENRTFVQSSVSGGIVLRKKVAGEFTNPAIARSE
jgi:hypothetical protein